MFVNAALGKPTLTKVVGFDDETFDVYYPTGAETLRVGAKVVAIGEVQLREDDGSQVFRLTYFEPVSAHSQMSPALMAHPAAPEAMAQPAASASPAAPLPTTQAAGHMAAMAPPAAPVPVTASSATYSNGAPIDPTKPLF
jgi:hypothetical protein